MPRKKKTKKAPLKEHTGGAMPVTKLKAKGGLIVDSLGKRATHGATHDNEPQNKKGIRQERIERVKMQKRFSDLTLGSKGLPKEAIMLRPEAIPQDVPQMRMDLNRDKQVHTRKHHGQHLSLDFFHRDIGVRRSRRGLLDLKDFSKEHAVALRLAVMNRSHGQREELQKVFRAIHKTKSGAGLQRIARSGGLASDLMYRIFEAPVDLDSLGEMHTNVGIDPEGRSMGIDPRRRMDRMLEHALATMLVEDFRAAD